MSSPAVPAIWSGTKEGSRWCCREVPFHGIPGMLEFAVIGMPGLLGFIVIGMPGMLVFIIIGCDWWIECKM